MIAAQGLWVGKNRALEALVIVLEFVRNRRDAEGGLRTVAKTWSFQDKGSGGTWIEKGGKRETLDPCTLHKQG